MGAPLNIQSDLEAMELRRLARRERDGRVAARLIALANVLDGMNREAAARAAGMDRQTLRFDACVERVIRCNAEGVDGLRDQPRSGRPARMTEGQQATLKAIVLRGPEGVIDHRYTSAWLYAAVRPGTDEAFALVMPEVSAAARQAVLDGFAATLPERVQAALLLDGAGWHIAADLVVPASISLVFLPPYSPNLNPVERVWLYLRERYLSLRLGGHAS